MFMQGDCPRTEVCALNSRIRLIVNITDHLCYETTLLVLNEITSANMIRTEISTLFFPIH